MHVKHSKHCLTHSRRSMTISLYYDLASRQLFPFSLDCIVPHFSWLWTSVSLLSLQIGFPENSILVLNEWHSGVIKAPGLSISIVPSLAWWFFTPRLASHDYKMAAAAPGIMSSYNFIWRQEGVQSCVFDQEWGALPKSLPANFPLSQTSLARVVSYTHA